MCNIYSVELIHLCNLLFVRGRVFPPGRSHGPGVTPTSLVVRGLLLLGGLLQPLDEGLHVAQEDLPSLWAAALPVPQHDGVLVDDVGVVHQLDDLREELEDRGILVEVHLDRVHQHELLPRGLAVGLEQLDPCPEQLEHALVGLLLRGGLVRPLDRVHDAPPQHGDDVHDLQLELVDLRGGNLQALLHAPLLLDVGAQLGLQSLQVRVAEPLLVQVHQRNEAALREVRVEVVDRPLALGEEVEHLVVQPGPLEEHVQLVNGVLAQVLLAEGNQEGQRGSLVDLGVVQQGLHHGLGERAELHVEDQRGRNRELGLTLLVEKLELPEELAQGGLQTLDQKGLLSHDHLHELDVREDLLPGGARGKDVEVEVVVPLPTLVAAGRGENPTGEEDLEEGLIVAVVVQVGLVDAAEGALEGALYVAVGLILSAAEDVQQALGEGGRI
mmetsp:Transcript_75/g.291  ORF Transcript_75/g.291 Transcript_75/m.291 type:complete len:441 (-) Transcript_75:158-1480(-)